MILMKRFCFALLSAAVTACGGAGSSAPATTYSFVAPKINSQRIYSKTIIDNSSNTINQTIRDTTTAVNSDGSYVVVQDDPNNNSVTVNGTTYSIQTETVNLNSSGQEISYSYTPAGGSLTTCTYAPHGAGPDYPIVIGKTWSLTYTFICPSTLISISHTGSAIDVESVTVPAGTFSAVKMQSTISWTDSNGTTHTETITNWRNASTGISVKELISTAYSGTVPSNGYPVTTTSVLQSGVP
jgi:hypothetical protein